MLWLIKGLGPGGAERLLVLSARFRDRRRVAYEVAYLLPWKDALVGDLAAEGVPATCLGARGSWDLRWTWRLRRHLLAHPVDVVHAHSPLAAIGARLVLRTLRRGRRPRLVTTEHNVWESHTRLTSRTNAVTARLDDQRLAVSAAVRDSMPARYRQATEVVRYGVDVDGLRAHGGSRAEVRREL
ncbi:MAG: glycosyltransferase, partial [Acidimicrobiales bacterium]|nr:glycosyltransferase [Acidimicrobiales bacterium]